MKRLPTLLAAMVLALCSAMLIFNMLAGTLAHANGIRFWSYPLFAALKGVTEKVEKQRLTLHSVLDGSFQAAYALQVGPRVPIFEFAVRLRNQIEYTALGASATPSIIVGADRELIEHVYTDDYCSRDLASFVPQARMWAAKIRHMQDVVERRGKTFLYVVTPSKVGQYPEFMPPGMPCPAPVSDRTGLVPAWIALVRAAGVHVVDTTAIVTEAHGRYPFDLYPRGGTHWNAIGAALAGQAIASELRQLRQDPNLQPLGFHWDVAEQPSDIDTDLAVLMNLLWLPDPRPTPDVQIQEVAVAGSCAPLHVLIVGGSFAHALGASLSEQPCRPDVIEYEYWHTFVLTWDDGEAIEHPFSRERRAADIGRADVILYEDNEQMLGRSEHGHALYDYITKGLP